MATYFNAFANVYTKHAKQNLNYDNQFDINSTYTIVIVVAVAMPIICVALWTSKWFLAHMFSYFFFPYISACIQWIWVDFHYVSITFEHLKFKHLDAIYNGWFQFFVLFCYSVLLDIISNYVDDTLKMTLRKWKM